MFPVLSRQKNIISNALRSRLVSSEKCLDHYEEQAENYKNGKACGYAHIAKYIQQKTEHQKIANCLIAG